MTNPWAKARGAATAAVKRALVPLLYRHAPVGLQPDRLYTWLDVLRATHGVPGTIVEVGCSVGGTAAFSYRFLRRQGDLRPYTCIDTFAGFPDDQFDADVALGDRPENRSLFLDNSEDLCRAVLQHHGAGEVRLVRGDIARLDPALLPDPVSAVLVDVDLAVPVEAALEAFWPRLSPGGVLLVDDCPPVCDWQARVGYERFIRRHGLPQVYRCDMGFVARATPLPGPLVESAS